MPRLRFIAVLVAAASVGAPAPALSQSEVIDIHRKVDAALDIHRKMDAAVNARREERSANIERRARQLEEEHRQELEVMRQQEELRRNPGSFPRRRLSYEAQLSDNPWAREAAKKRGAPIRIEIFVSEKCVACDRMEQYLDDVGVAYHRHLLIPGSDAEQQYLAQIGRGQIPVVRVNGRVVRGYLPEEVRALILEEKPKAPPPDADVPSTVPTTAER